MKVTRIAISKHITKSKLDRLTALASRLGALRTEIWDKYGSVAGVGLDHRTLRDQWLAENRQFDVPARLWKETLRSVFCDITLYREAAKVKVRKAIRCHTKNKDEQKRLYTLLKADRWLEDSYLRRMMRKHFKHGRTSVENQIVLDPCCYEAFSYKGKAWVDVMSLERGKRIAIPLNTTAQPDGTLRLILRAGNVEVHYLVETAEEETCGNKTLGIDKGYTEAFVDSDGDRHGQGLGKLLSAESNYLKKKYQHRNRLKAIAKKKPHVLIANLSRDKLDERKKKHCCNVRDRIFKAAHAVVDKAKVIACEDLTSPIPDKGKRSKVRPGRDQKRRLSGWVKGVLAEALQTVTRRRGASLLLVNASYTSQIDSRYGGVLLGARSGDLFYGFDRVVQDADTNAARNILARLTDKEVTLFTPYKEVKAILLRRTATVQERWGLLHPGSSCNDSNCSALSTECELPSILAHEQF